MMNSFKFLQSTQERRPIVPSYIRNNAVRAAVFVDGWEAARRGEHAIRTRNGGNPYPFGPLRHIWLTGWRHYLAETTYD
jgi:ribosome modulation factor